MANELGSPSCDRGGRIMRKRQWIWVALFLLTVLIGLVAGQNWHGRSPAYLAVNHFRKDTALSEQLSQFSPSAPDSSTAPSISQVNAPTVDSKRLFAHVQALAFERHSESDRLQAREYILKALEQAGWQPYLQVFSSGVNVVAERAGTDSQAGSILVAAHFDTVVGSPGADDNATGVATTLEVAQLLGSRSTPRTLRVTFFDQEERGLLGSFAFTSDANLPQDLQGVIIPEMLGYACYEPGCQKYPVGLPFQPKTSQGDFLAAIGDQEHLPLLEAFHQPAKPGQPAVITLPIPLRGLLTPDLLRSDHAPFWQKGIGAVVITDTANFRTPHYHQPSDTPDKIDQKFFAGSAQVVVNAVSALLEGRHSLATSSNS
ncbi:M28 family peptidase [Trichocoleus sp. FACHB-262]|uniref:M28 family peptidase n=1 Tax=Trichocoleus sp. FACHB-262 TaxID=2692869 RepID=UPI0018EFF748|nr:M28 family peptidase [Trichocoleus sp. FACHB-262]